MTTNELRALRDTGAREYDALRERDIDLTFEVEAYRRREVLSIQIAFLDDVITGRYVPAASALRQATACILQVQS